MRASAGAAALSLLVLIPAGAVAAQAAPASPGTSVAVPAATAPPHLDGKVDASWASAVSLELNEDFTNRRSADEPTEVRVMQDAGGLDVAFIASQRGTITAAQNTNAAGVESDDYVVVYLWPQGVQGFAYAFYANPRGARYQTSSENSAYTPQWAAVGRGTPGGYVVTMRIPLAAIRSGGATAWRAQFGRAIVATNASDVWAFSSAQASLNDPSYAGILTGVAASATRPKPRIQVYGLGELTPSAYGGDTSRVGADISLPVTPTSSLVAAIHPDYSNVEVDQQTIAPNAFAYQYTEYRPFFTQAAQPFNNVFTSVNGPMLLYTPSIPTFRDGYAYEGTQGPFSFGAFDAVGVGRTDQGQTVSYYSANQVRSFGASLQRLGVDTVDGIHDETDSFATAYRDQIHHVGVYAQGGIERGDVADPGLARYLQTGLTYGTATTFADVNYQTIGADFAPVDAYVAQTDITGLQGYLQQSIPFGAQAMLHDLYGTFYLSRYHDRFGRPDNVAVNPQLNIDFRNLFTVHLIVSDQEIETYDREQLPFNTNGVYVGYRVATTTPSYVQHTEGAYAHGRLDAWNYISTLQLAPRLHLGLELDEDKYLTSWTGESSGTQWLERASFDWQFSRLASFDLGLRKITGPYLPTAEAPPNFQPINAGNVTAAFHFLSARDEFYIVYGNPDSVATTPALYVKWIRYIGAPKGT